MPVPHPADAIEQHVRLIRLESRAEGDLVEGARPWHLGVLPSALGEVVVVGAAPRDSDDARGIDRRHRIDSDPGVGQVAVEVLCDPAQAPVAVVAGGEAQDILRVA